MPDDIESPPLQPLFEIDGFDFSIPFSAKRPVSSSSNNLFSKQSKRQRIIELETENTSLRHTIRTNESDEDKYLNEVERLQTKLEKAKLEIDQLKAEKETMIKETQRLHLLICLLQTDTETEPEEWLLKINQLADDEDAFFNTTISNCNRS